MPVFSSNKNGKAMRGQLAHFELSTRRFSGLAPLVFAERMPQRRSRTRVGVSPFNSPPLRETPFS